MAIPKELAKKIADARPSNHGIPIVDGDYVLMIKRIIAEEKYKGFFFIPEFEVVESEAKVSGVIPNKVGSECSCCWALNGSGKGGDAQRGNAQNFSVALLGLSRDDPEYLEKISSMAGKEGSEDSLRARGMLVLCSTYRQVIQSGPKAGTEGVFPRFTHVGHDVNAPAEIAARAKTIK